MKETVLDVLVYLFENYMEGEAEFIADEESVRTELLEAGFPRTEIIKAFSWLEGLVTQQRDGLGGTLVTNSLRVYNGAELEKLDVECRGFLLFLEQVGVLDALTRELVVDRVMALETDDVDLEQIKWVVLMVLFNQPGQEAAFAWIEDLVFNEARGYLH